MPKKRADVWASVQEGGNGELSEDSGHASESDGEGRQERQNLDRPEQEGGYRLPSVC